MAHVSDFTALFDSRRWGLPPEVVGQLADRLYQFWLRFRGCFKTQTRDTSPKAYNYLRGQLTMDTERNFANMDRTLNGGDGQSLQHFMSNSPWSGQVVFRQIQDEIKATPVLQQGSVLILDESADEKAGPPPAGAARQDNGRLGAGSIPVWPMPMSEPDGGSSWTGSCSCPPNGSGMTLPRPRY